MEKKLLFVASTGPHIRQFHLPYLQRLKQEGWRIHAACSRGGGMIPYAERVLMTVPKNCPEYAEVSRLMKFLSYFNAVSDKDVPATSMIRSFIGGSSL